MFCHKGICIRAIEKKDIKSIRRLRNDPTTWIYLTDSSILDERTQKRWFESLAGQDRKKYFVLFDNRHSFLGIARFDEIDNQNRSIRVGCDIAPKLRGRGYGDKAFALIKKYCFDYLNMHRIWLAVLENNKKARGLYRKHGFIEEGRFRQAVFKDGGYLDYIIMSLLREEYRNR